MRLGTRVRMLELLLDRLPYPDVAAMTPQDIQRSRRPRPGTGPTALVVGRRVRGVRVEDRTVAGDAGPLPARVYRPSAAVTAVRPPAVLHYHGGGWVVGSHLSADWLCSGLADALGAVVVSVGYRLAPEHRAPAAALDCFAALCDVAGHAREWGVDPQRLAVMGDSAGGNLAAVVCLLARDEGGPALVAQELIYPGVDATLSSLSIEALAQAPFLTRSDIHAYLDHYLGPDGDIRDARVSPLLAADHAGLPAALIQTAEHDPLVDDGSRYAQALRAAGVPVRYTRYLGVPHGFMNLPGLTRAAAQARAEIADHLAAAFGVAWPVTSGAAGPRWNRSGPTRRPAARS